MAGRQQQLGFESAERDARAAYQERNNELRSRLRSIEVSLTGLSARRWKHVTEMLMSAWSHATTTTGDAGKPLDRFVATSGLSRDQFYRAREDAVELGLLAVTQCYRGRQRHPDRLDVNVGMVDRLVEQSRFWRDEKLRPGATRCDQVRPGATSIKEDNCARVLPKKPKKLNTTSSSSPARELSSTEIDRLIAEVEEVVGEFGFEITYLAEAVRQASRAGCSRQQILARVGWFGDRLDWWQVEFRPGALYTGIFCTRPTQPVEKGWPHLEKRRLTAERQQREQDLARQRRLESNLRHQARIAEAEATGERERQLGPQLDAMSTAELEELERATFRSGDFARRLRGRVGYRQAMLAVLGQRLKGAEA
jgi:hypothetical protein